MKNRTKRIKVVVTGATGRMGQMLVQQILADKKLSLFGATERPNHKKIGFDIGDSYNILGSFEPGLDFNKGNIVVSLENIDYSPIAISKDIIIENADEE